jgi:hypothetical protein
MERIMACLLAEIGNTQEKMDAKMNANQAEMLAKMRAITDAHHERMIPKVDAWIKGKEACVGKLEANPEKSDAVVEHREVPKEKAAVKPVRTLKKRHRNRHLAAWRHWKAKKRTQGNGGSRK